MVASLAGLAEVGVPHDDSMVVAGAQWLLAHQQPCGGWGESATDGEIVDAIKLLARTEGIFTEPAGGAEVAVTKKLIEQGRIPRDESIVISITGNGYKTIEVMAGRGHEPIRIGRSLKEFEASVPVETGVR